MFSDLELSLVPGFHLPQVPILMFSFSEIYFVLSWGTPLHPVILPPSLEAEEDTQFSQARWFLKYGVISWNDPKVFRPMQLKSLPTWWNPKI